MAKDNYARRETFGRIPRTIPVSHAETLRRSEAKGHGDSSFWWQHMATPFCTGKTSGVWNIHIEQIWTKILAWFWSIDFYRSVLSAWKFGAGASHTRIQCLSFPFPSADLGCRVRGVHFEVTVASLSIVQGIMFTLFYQRKRGSAFFSEDGHCWCLLLFCKAAAPRPDPSHCSWYFANVDIWTCGNDLEGILMIPYSYDYISLWWVTNPPFKGLNCSSITIPTSWPPGVVVDDLNLPGVRLEFRQW